MDILKIHLDCYNKLIEEDLPFMPRLIDNRGRLKKGYIFIGNDNYAHISLWDSKDTKEKIHNIGFVVLKDGSSYLEITARDNDNKADYINKLVATLKTNSPLIYKEVRQNKWNAHYQGLNYLENLDTFLRVERNIINSFISKEDECPIKSISKTKFDKAIRKIQQYVFESNSAFKPKKETPVKIEKSDYEMNLHHNKIQNKLMEYFNHTKQYKNIFLEKNYVDLIGEYSDGTIDYYEVKPYIPKIAIRTALGQLLEYSYFKSDDVSKLIVVSSYKPDDSIIKYLKHLRETYHLNLYYTYIDLESGILSKDLY